MISFTFATALCTDRPSYSAGSLSRRTKDSCMPTEEPVGAAAVPTEPSTVTTSTSTIGRHLQSMIWRAWTLFMRLPLSFFAGSSGTYITLKSHRFVPVLPVNTASPIASSASKQAWPRRFSKTSMPFSQAVS